MLILSRKRGEIVMIGDDVEVHVLDIGDGKVRLGVVGPAWIPVHNRERYGIEHLKKRGGDAVRKVQDPGSPSAHVLASRRPCHSGANSR